MLNKEIMNNFVKYDGDSLKLLFIYLYIYSLVYSYFHSLTLSFAHSHSACFFRYLKRLSLGLSARRPVVWNGSVSRISIALLQQIV